MAKAATVAQPGPATRTGRWSRNFRLVYAAHATSKVGTQISYLAVPVLAVSVLGASPAQVGLLGVLSTAAFLLIGLPAGVWVDRAPRRSIMIAADVARAALLSSVPLTWLTGHLSFGQLCVVVSLLGVGTVFFDVAAQSYLPQVVGRDRLVAANALLASTAAGIQVAGRGVGGYLVGLLTAPVTVALDAASYLCSALLLARLRPGDASAGEPTVAPEAGRASGADDVSGDGIADGAGSASGAAAAGFRRQLVAGLRHVLGDPLLRPIALSGALVNLSVHLAMTMLPVLFLRELKLSAAVLGLFVATGGIGIFLGAATARRLARWLGDGPALCWSGVVTAPLGAALAILDRGPILWLGAAGWLLATWRIGVHNVIQVSLRQWVTPDAMLGRMNATFRFLLTGALAVGAGLAGLIGDVAGPRLALWAGAAGLALSWLPLLLSPVRRLRHADRAR
mgnify:CR=1 FL=1